MSSPQTTEDRTKTTILTKLSTIHSLLAEIEHAKLTINALDDAYFKQVYDQELYLSDVLDGKLAHSQFKIRPLLDQLCAGICQKSPTILDNARLVESALLPQIDRLFKKTSDFSEGFLATIDPEEFIYVCLAVSGSGPVAAREDLKPGLDGVTAEEWTSLWKMVGDHLGGGGVPGRWLFHKSIQGAIVKRSNMARFFGFRKAYHELEFRREEETKGRKVSLKRKVDDVSGSQRPRPSVGDDEGVAL